MHWEICHNPITAGNYVSAVKVYSLNRSLITRTNSAARKHASTPAHKESHFRSRAYNKQPTYHHASAIFLRAHPELKPGPPSSETLCVPLWMKTIVQQGWKKRMKRRWASFVLSVQLVTTSLVQRLEMPAVEENASLLFLESHINHVYSHNTAHDAKWSIIPLSGRRGNGHPCSEETITQRLPARLPRPVLFLSFRWFEVYFAQVLICYASNRCVILSRFQWVCGYVGSRGWKRYDKHPFLSPSRDVLASGVRVKSSRANHFRHNSKSSYTGFWEAI